MTPTDITNELVAKLRPLEFSSPVHTVYNPLLYARAPYDLYLERFCQAPKEVVFVGMNPGPWGMAQTGVPFGEVAFVRDFLKCEGVVGKPVVEHPKRLVTGFACTRSEVSGSRVWGWVRDRFGTPEAFFKRFFIANYCPLVFMEEGGANRTPDKLPRLEREPLFAACDEALRRLIEFLQPKVVVGIGAFAEGRARAALEGLDVRVGRVLHPSPASPLANRGWAEQMEQELALFGVDVSGQEIAPSAP